jgi:hypothetical protein
VRALPFNEMRLSFLIHSSTILLTHLRTAADERFNNSSHHDLRKHNNAATFLARCLAPNFPRCEIREEVLLEK